MVAAGRFRQDHCCRRVGVGCLLRHPDDSRTFSRGTLFSPRGSVVASTFFGSDIEARSYTVDFAWGNLATLLVLGVLLIVGTGLLARAQHR